MAAAIVVSGGVARAWADGGQVTVDEENDFFSPHNLDRHFTQGLRFDYLSPDLQPGLMTAPMEWLGSFLPIFPNDAAARSRRFDVFAGQQLFTPQNKALGDPDPRDRPYAGWVNGGVGFIQDSNGCELDHLEVQLGLVGPSAAGEATQNRFHIAINDPSSQGWGYQLRNEPTLQFYYDRHERVTLLDDDALVSADVIPQGAVAAGNAYDYGGVGTLLRIGHNLKVDYGPASINPGLAGTEYFRKPERESDQFGWYLFAGADGQAVGHDIFLNGNTWQASRSVPMKPLVGELELGGAVSYSDWIRLTYTYTSVTKEFYGQDGNDDLGTITLSFHVPL